MRILIVDDNPQRYARLPPRLEAVGLHREILEFSGSANDARRRLEACTYDLVLFDILIPLWPDTEADRQHSADLLADIIGGEGLRRPGHIVGISADREAALASAPDFARHLWTVVSYSESDDEWLTQLLNCIVYIRDSLNRESPAAYGVDVAVVCALSEPELSEVLRLPWDFQPPRPMDDLTFVHEGTFKCDGKDRSVVALAAPRMGMISAGLITARVIDKLRPKLVVMTGICAGIKGQVNLGDVIFVDPCWDWQSGKYLREREGPALFAIAPHQVGPSAAVRAHIGQIRADRQQLAAISVQGPDEAPAVLKVVLGPVASGSAVIADEMVVAEIKKQNREVCGIEMEAYGVFSAVENCSGLRPEVLALKAVCDFADPQKGDKVQRYAAYASARVMQLFVERYFDRVVGLAVPITLPRA